MTDNELEMLVQCCVCKEYTMKGYREYWFKVDEATDMTLQQHPISHGLCYNCLIKEYQKLGIDYNDIKRKKIENKY